MNGTDPKPTTVYTCLDVEDRPLYVGSSTQHYIRFRGHTTKPWWTEVATIRIAHFPDRPSASNYERALIEELQPAYNIAGIPPEVLAGRDAA